MSTPKQVNATRIVFKKGSYEWLIHFGFPIGLFSIAVVGLFSVISQITSRTYINNVAFEFYLPILLLGILTYYLQVRKLNLVSSNLYWFHPKSLIVAPYAYYADTLHIDVVWPSHF
jgi:hypothetical protein